MGAFKDGTASFFVHKPRGFESNVAWPARPRDAVGIPQNIRIIAALEKWKCTAKVIHNGYDVINEFGDAIELPFGATEEDWESAAEVVSKHRG